MSVKIGHASIDEHGKISGGSSGDQTGKEVCIRDWYNKPWNAVIRSVDSSVADKIATAIAQACYNDNIGYDQSQRLTLYYEAKNVNWDLSKITNRCECDCSSLVAVAVNCAGIPISSSCTTSNLVSACFMTGKFKILRDTQYTTKSDSLLRGDILVKEGSHTAVVLSSNSTGDTSSSDSSTSDTSGKTATLMTDPVKYTSYTAGSGDTLSSIAEKFDTSVSMILYLNPDITTSTNLKGKKLKLVVSTSKAVGSISSSQSITKKHREGITVSSPYATCI